MKTSITFGAGVLALATVATSCASVGGQTAGSGSAYFVGVAGGG